MKVLVVAPVLTRTGYGEHARFVLRALRNLPGIDLFVSPTEWGRSGWIWEDTEEREWIDGLIKKAALHQQQKAPFDASIQVGIPNEWKKLAPINIGVTAGIETTLVAPVWLERANMMDKVITVSEHSKNIFDTTSYEGVHRETGQKVVLSCNTPIEVVHYPVKKYDKVDLPLELDTSFNFLTMAQWGPRKNMENTIKWFVEEFIDNPEAGLVVKTFAKGGSLIDRTMAMNTLAKVLEKYKQRQCKIYLLHGDMSEEEIHSLYTHSSIKALVSLSHGEGYGLPHFEAAYSGLPVVAPEWSGYLDFLCMPKKSKKGGTKVKAQFAAVDFDLLPVQKEAVWDGVIQADSKWAFPMAGSYKMKLREIYKDYGRFKKQAKSLQKWITKNFEAAGQQEKLKDSIMAVLAETGNFVSDEELDNIFETLVQEG